MIPERYQYTSIYFSKDGDHRKDIYEDFIDYEMLLGFHHETLVNIRRTSAIDGRDLRIIENLYWKQKAIQWKTDR